MGVAPAEPGRLDTFPPRANAGNIDTKDLVAGSTAFLPVLVPEALFSIGDCHAAQGDGAQGATRYMIEWIVAEYGLSVSDAYIICSIAADLHISEIVDAPNWIVSMHLPLGIWV